jgi:hypothetical protein
MANISTLQQSLINAKKVMNKVDGGNFSRENITIPKDIEPISEQNLPPTGHPVPTMSSPTNTERRDLSPKASITEERINNSNLPDAIKEAMINNPIPDVPFNGSVGLDNDFLSNVRTEMDKQGMSTNPTSVTTSHSPIQQPSNTKKISSSNLKSVIKEAVKELLEETISAKLHESIGPRKSAGENFQFTVGDRVFYGKITSSKTIK